MSAIVAALAPVLGLILLGYVLRRVRLLPGGGWRGIERLTYYVLFPMLLIGTLGEQRLDGAPWPAMLAVVLGVVTTSAASLVFVHRFVGGFSGPTFSSVFQGGVRFNTYIALAVAESFFGAGGLAMAAVAAGFMIVLINLYCVCALAVWGQGRAARSGLSKLLSDVAGNPLILACAAGWLISLGQIAIPGALADLLETAGSAALPLGLLAVGAALRPTALRGHAKEIALSSLAQFGLKPLAAALMVTVTGLAGVPAAALFIAFSTPTAPSAYILAAELGGDTEAMASIITAQTLLAFPCMPILCGLLFSIL